MAFELKRDILYNINRFLMRMNKAGPTMSGSLIKYRAYLTYIKYNKNLNSSSSSSSNNNNKEEEINENLEIKDYCND